MLELAVIGAREAAHPPEASAGDVRQRLVSISPYVPHPRINHAGGNFLLEYLPRMSRWFDITVISPATAENVVAASYAPSGISVHLFPLAPGWYRVLHALKNHPLDTAIGFNVGFLVRAAFEADRQSYAIVHSADVVEIQFTQYLPFLDSVKAISPTVPTAAHEHDVFSDYVADVVRSSKSWVHRTHARARAWRIRNEERRLLNLCATVITHNFKDRDGLRALGVRVPIEVVYPPVTIPESPAHGNERPTVSFAGAMWRPENQSGVEWFLSGAWPRVHAVVPHARFVVAGYGPSGWLSDISATPGVETTGFLPSLDPVYDTSTMAVTPLLGSAGIKVKALQAMAFGLPVVSTIAGAAGIAGRSGIDTFAAITDDPGEFAAAVIRCLTDAEFARSVGHRAREWVVTNCNFDESVRRIASRYESLALNATHRQS